MRPLTKWWKSYYRRSHVKNSWFTFAKLLHVIENLLLTFALHIPMHISSTSTASFAAAPFIIFFFFFFWFEVMAPPKRPSNELVESTAWRIVNDIHLQMDSIVFISFMNLLIKSMQSINNKKFNFAQFYQHPHALFTNTWQWSFWILSAHVWGNESTVLCFFTAIRSVNWWIFSWVIRYDRILFANQWTVIISHFV